MIQQPEIVLKHGAEYICASVSQELYDRIKRELTRASVVHTSEKSYVVNDLIKQLLIDKQWNNNSEFEVKILSPVLEAFNLVDIDPQKFLAYVKSLRKSSNKIRQHLLGSQGITHDLYDLMLQEFKELFIQPNQSKILFDAIYNITPVGIGRGEIVLTLMSDSVKCSRGDLTFDDTCNIDVKGGGCRLGGDGFAVDRSPILIDNILQQAGINIRQTMINNICTRMIGILPKHAQYDEMRDAIANRKFVANHVAIDDLKTLSPRKSADIQRCLQRVLKLVSNHKPINFNDATSTFFNNTRALTYQHFINGIAMMRSYHMREHVEHLKNALQQLIAPDEQHEFKTPSKYLSLIAALHLVCYVVTENRDGVIFLNDNNKTAISFRTQHNILNDLIAAYNMFTHHDFKLCAAVDHRGKTISVKFNE